MTLQTLTLSNFRSYGEHTFAFQPGINIITGPNGSGKTNLLEAVYMLGLTRSFRGSSRDVSRDGAAWFRVSAELENREHIALVRQKNQKQPQYNQETVKIRDFIGTLPVVAFEPGGLNVISDSPAYRRQLLDRILCLTDREYMKALLQLRRIVKQRNALLRQADTTYDDVFGWDVLLVEPAAYIYAQRQTLVDRLNHELPGLYARIAGSSDVLELEYVSTVAEGTYTDAFLDRLQRTFERDRMLGNTSSGPHRDDITIYYNQRRLASVGSRGETRTTALAITLAEFEYVRQFSRTAPVVLLDDVFSELDRQRQSALLDNLVDTQVLITTTDLPASLPASYHQIELPV